MNKLETENLVVINNEEGFSKLVKVNGLEEEYLAVTENRLDEANLALLFNAELRERRVLWDNLLEEEYSKEIRKAFDLEYLTEELKPFDGVAVGDLDGVAGRGVKLSHPGAPSYVQTSN